MKKRWLVLGLAAIMSLGCMFACGKDGDDSGDTGNTGETVVKGEKVTAEQWAAAMANVDCKNLYWEEYFKDISDGETEEEWVIEQYAENIFYELENEFGDEDRNWFVYNNGKIYEYEVIKEGDGVDDDDSRTVDWHVTSKNYTTDHMTKDKAEIIEYIGCYFSHILYLEDYEYNNVFEERIENYTFDEEKGVYYRLYNQTRDNGNIDKERLEFLFKNGKLYSIVDTVEYVRTDGDYDLSVMTLIFGGKDIELPNEEGLNALIAQNG